MRYTIVLEKLEADECPGPSRWLAGAVALLLCVAAGGGCSRQTNAGPGDSASNPSQIKPPDRSLNRFIFAGQVVDERGKPVAGAQVTATARYFQNGSFAYIDVVKTDALGRFRIDRARAISGQYIKDLGSAIIRLAFDHPDFCHARLEDVRVLTPVQCADLHITLHDGRVLKGRVVDPEGGGLSGVMVQAVYKQDEARDYRKAALTDADGQFELRGLTATVASVQALATDAKLPLLSGQISVDLAKAAEPVAIHVTPIVLARGQAVHELFGMKLVDADEDLQARFFLYSPKRLIILDAGPDVARLRIGNLRRGDAFWFVGNEPIANFDEFARRLLTECEIQQKAGRHDFACRVVYDFSSVDYSGTNTQYMHLTEDDLQELRAQTKQ